MANTAPVDIGGLLDDGAWSRLGKALVFLTAMTLVIDGFDNQALGLALPAILKEWGATRAQFAPVVALGLIGMTIGAGFGGLMGDRIGRKRALLASVVLFGIATLAIAFTATPGQIGLLRFFAGAGVGGALPNATAIAAEFTPRRQRPFAVTATIVCVPLGGMVGGVAAGLLLPSYGWRSLFILGGLIPVVAAAALLVFMPESPRYLARLPGKARELAVLMRRLGHPVADDASFVDQAEAANDGPKGLRALFSPLYLQDTLALWGAFFFSLFAIYSVFSWVPTLLATNGLDLTAASNGTAVYNFGGVIGALFCAWLIGKLGSRIAMIGLAVLAAITAVILAYQPISPDNLGSMTLWLGLNGFFVNAVQTTTYALAAYIYATSLRSTGAGAALSVGRLGAILSSFTGPVVMAGGPGGFYWSLAAAMVLNGVCLAFVRRHIPKR